MASKIDISECNNNQNDRIEMLKAFDETKAGVKGLLDSGLSKIPQIFVRPSEELSQDELKYNKTETDHHQVPVIDLTGIQQDPDRRKQIVEQVRTASEIWGFFQVVNHGIHVSVLDRMISGIQKFNEQDIEEKRRYYTRDTTGRVAFNSNFDLFKSRTANWRDTLGFRFPDEVIREELPASCRESTVEYSKHVAILGNTLLELLSEALGLKRDHLCKMECSKVSRISCHYYPACPEPELTLGATKHSDPGFITILLQNQINGLQVAYEGQWVNIQPIPGGLVVNIGDLLQMVSNGKFISNKHRVVANRMGPRISVASFCSGPLDKVIKMCYGPIKELISEENPPKYREVILSEYMHKFVNIGLDEDLSDYYKL